jgi:hypothetical protein
LRLGQGDDMMSRTWRKDVGTAVLRSCKCLEPSPDVPDADSDLSSAATVEISSHFTYHSYAVHTYRDGATKVKIPIFVRLVLWTLSTLKMLTA